MSATELRDALYGLMLAVSQARGGWRLPKDSREARALAAAQAEAARVYNATAEGSPQLDEPLRSRERAALDRAIGCLNCIALPAGDETPLERRMRLAAHAALDAIDSLLPGSTGRGSGE